MEFREDLNIIGMTCPPAEAASGKYTVYRFVNNIPLKVEDIWSHRAIYPTQVFPDECIARACSVFTDYKDLKRLRKVPKFNRMKVVIIRTEEKDGVFLKTSVRSHLSWWISREFELTSIKEAI